jgi:hypothetical protein
MTASWTYTPPAGRARLDTASPVHTGASSLSGSSRMNRRRMSRPCSRSGNPWTPASGTGPSGLRAAGRCPASQSGSGWR